MNKIAITTGDPNGIGAEITIKALNKLDLPADKIVLISNRKILDFYCRNLRHPALDAGSLLPFRQYPLCCCFVK